MHIDEHAVQQICAGHQIKIEDCTSSTGSFDKKIFFINQAFLLRVSAAPMTLEQEKFRRVAGLNFVPQICHTGALERGAESIFYTLLTLLPGDDFVNAYPMTTSAQQQQLGRAVAAFLDRLHTINGTLYDIGMYEPAVPSFAGTWRAGHQKYWERLRQESQKIHLQPGSIQVFNRAFSFLQAASTALDFQTGPRLLHNDFHPKNILLCQGQFSGVIDWECSQFGEADFELCHLIHWCLYPPEPGIDFRPFLRAVFKAAPICARVPHLARRLTIYQVEHELQQIIWNVPGNESWRVPRLADWMDGDVDRLLQEIAAQSPPAGG